MKKTIFSVLVISFVSCSAFASDKLEELKRQTEEMLGQKIYSTGEPTQEAPNRQQPAAIQIQKDYGYVLFGSSVSSDGVYVGAISTADAVRSRRRDQDE